MTVVPQDECLVDSATKDAAEEGEDAAEESESDDDIHDPHVDVMEGMMFKLDDETMDQLEMTSFNPSTSFSLSWTCAMHQSEEDGVDHVNGDVVNHP
mmetsp:Transcript_42210/g.48922  ORF Transcript_42210/g.48922 Transcript_42210/m.48922 type:complete len:97 (+) Transcript_42210:2-292(+)